MNKFISVIKDEHNVIKVSGDLSKVDLLHYNLDSAQLVGLGQNISPNEVEGIYYKGRNRVAVVNVAFNVWYGVVLDSTYDQLDQYAVKFTIRYRKMAYLK